MNIYECNEEQADALHTRNLCVCMCVCSCWADSLLQLCFGFKGKDILLFLGALCCLLSVVSWIWWLDCQGKMVILTLAHSPGSSLSLTDLLPGVKLKFEVWYVTCLPFWRILGRLLWCMLWLRQKVSRQQHTCWLF